MNKLVNTETTWASS